jgi:hypothetical protein
MAGRGERHSIAKNGNYPPRQLLLLLLLLWLQSQFKHVLVALNGVDQSSISPSNYPRHYRCPTILDRGIVS